MINEDQIGLLRQEYIVNEPAALPPIIDAIRREIVVSELLSVKKGLTEERKGAHPQLLLMESEKRVENAKREKEGVENSLVKIRERSRASGEMGRNLVVMASKMGEQGAFLESQASVAYETAATLADESANITKRTSELFTVIQEDVDLIKEAAADPKKDPKTGLATGRGLVEANAIRLKEIYKINNERERQDKLNDEFFVVIDMMLFHRGVIELGEDFDKRLKEYLAAGLISVAEDTARGDDGLYWEMKGEDIDKDSILNLYFPKGSEIRRMLDEIKELGVTFEPGRLNPGGGDEFVFNLVCNTDRKSEEEKLRKESGGTVAFTEQNVTDALETERNRRKLLAMEVVDRVVSSTTFSADRPVIFQGAEKKYSENEVAQRKRTYKLFYENLNLLVPAVNEEADVTEEMSRFFYSFKDVLRGYFQSTDSEARYFTQGQRMLSPEVDLRMDFAVVGKKVDYPAMSEVEKYASSIDEFVPGTEENQVYMKDLKTRLARKLSEDEINNPQVLEDRLVIEVNKDMLGRYQDYLFGQVNGEWKKRKKIEVMSMACRGNSQAIFTVGSVRESGRGFAEFDDFDRREIWANAYSYWIGTYDMELSKKNKGENYDSELVDGRIGSFLVKSRKMLGEVVGPGGITKWGTWIETKPQRKKP